MTITMIQMTAEERETNARLQELIEHQVTFSRYQLEAMIEYILEGGCNRPGHPPIIHVGVCIYAILDSIFRQQGCIPRKTDRVEIAGVQIRLDEKEPNWRVCER